jgi:hypothetical protein
MTTTTATKTPAVSAEIAATWLTLTFAHGETLKLDALDLSPEIREQALMHGLKQKLVDAAAIARNTDTGRSATVEDKFLAVREVYGRLLAGQWNKTRDGEGTSTGGLLFKALCRLAPHKTNADIRTYLGAMGKEQQAALRRSARIAPIIEQIKAESARDGGIDGDELLDGLL